MIEDSLLRLIFGLVTVVPVGLRPPFSCFLSGESKIGLICYLALLGGESGAFQTRDNKRKHS